MGHYHFFSFDYIISFELRIKFSHCMKHRTLFQKPHDSVRITLHSLTIENTITFSNGN